MVKQLVWNHYHYLDFVLYALYLAEAKTLDKGIETLRVRLFDS